jgi:predicted enzyme related to lactoylglutathione lyase
MITVTAFAFTAYPILDVAKSRAFYEGLLGLKPATVFEHGEKIWVEYELGDTTLAISNMSDQWKPSSDGPSIACEVANFDEAVAELRAAGVTFVVEPMDNEVCRMAVVLDPAGNTLLIHRRAAAEGMKP